MPLYDFKCADCGLEETYQLGMDETRPTVCPKCSGNLKRVFQAAPVHFGAGFPGNDIKKKDQYFKEYAEKKTGQRRE